jgi:hypothetical protein
MRASRSNQSGLSFGSAQQAMNTRLNHSMPCDGVEGETIRGWLIAMETRGCACSTRRSAHGATGNPAVPLHGPIGALRSSTCPNCGGHWISVSRKCTVFAAVPRRGPPPPASFDRTHLSQARSGKQPIYLTNAKGELGGAFDRLYRSVRFCSMRGARQQRWG